jgi:hypothetical protein
MAREADTIWVEAVEKVEAFLRIGFFGLLSADE